MRKELTEAAVLIGQKGSRSSLKHWPSSVGIVCLLAIAVSTTLYSFAAAQEQKNGARSAETTHREAVKQYERGDLAKAEGEFRKTLKLAPNNLPARYNLARVLLELGRIREGLAHYEYAAMKLHPDDADVRLRYGLALEHAKELTEAAKQLEQAIKLDPEKTESRKALIRVLLAQNMLLQATQVASDGIQRHSKDASMHNDYGVVLMQAGKHAAAEEIFLKAIELEPEHVDAQHNVGVVLMQQWKLEAAEKHFRQALTLEPEYADAHFHLAQVLSKSGQDELAKKSLEKLIGIQRSYGLAHYELGQIAARMGHHKQAIAKFTEALRHNPLHSKSQYHLGLALAKLGKPKVAIPQFEGVLLRQPGNPDAHYHLGLALHAVGQREPAISHLREAVWLRPWWEDAKQMLKEISTEK